MLIETAPVSDDEWLLRRVWIDRFRKDKVPLISPDAFAPRTSGRDIDGEGISLYRQSYLPSPDAVLATIPLDDKRMMTGIVRISVSALRELGLSVVAVPDERIPGHVVIPELNANDYHANRGRLALALTHLAHFASNPANILRYPQRV
jgi:hypothetical protein